MLGFHLLTRKILFLDMSNVDHLQGLLKIKLSLFCHFHVHPNYKLPLTWWKAHEAWFLNVALIAHQVFGILGSQIELEHIFIIVGVLTLLQRCKSEVENINKFIIILNNWPFDVCMEFDKKGGYLMISK